MAFSLKNIYYSAISIMLSKETRKAQRSNKLPERIKELLSLI
jgi:hypothetical protein